LRIKVNWNTTSILILLVGAAWIWLSRVPSLSASANGKVAPHPGFQAPDFTLQTSQGEMVTLSDLRGQAVIINLWASWCPPCRVEMPELQKVYQAYHDQGLQVLAVNVTSQDDTQAAVKFSAQLGLTFPILLDLDGDVSRAYRLQSLPTTYFVDRDGIIQDVVVGGPMAEALLRVRVENLLVKVGS